MNNETFYTGLQLGAAILEAQAGERRRIAAIMALPEAAGREKQALTIATTTAKSIEGAKAALTGESTAADATAAAWDTVLQRRGLTAAR